MYVAYRWWCKQGVHRAGASSSLSSCPVSCARAIRALHRRARVESMSRVGVGGGGIGRDRVGCWGSRRAVFFLVQAGGFGASCMRYTVPEVSVAVFGDLLRPSPLCYDVVRGWRCLLSRRRAT